MDIWRNYWFLDGIYSKVFQIFAVHNMIEIYDSMATQIHVYDLQNSLAYIVVFMHCKYIYSTMIGILSYYYIYSYAVINEPVLVVTLILMMRLTLP